MLIYKMNKILKCPLFNYTGDNLIDLYVVQLNLSKSSTLYVGIPSLPNMACGPKSTYSLDKNNSFKPETHLNP